MEILEEGGNGFLRSQNNFLYFSSIIRRPNYHPADSEIPVKNMEQVHLGVTEIKWWWSSFLL